MMLIIDIGNSCIKWAQLDHEQWRHSARVDVCGRDLYTLLDKNWLSHKSHAGMVEPERVVFSSVVEEKGRQLAAWCQTHWSCPVVEVLTTAEALGVQNAYREPERLGIDRWAAMIAAYRQHQTDICVVDCGTALTIDLVNAAGKHLGGYIVPGLNTMQKSLNQHTEAIQANLDLHTDKNSHTVAPGTSTRQAVERGVVLAAVGLIEQAIAYYRRTNHVEPVCVLTGGDAECLTPYLSKQVRHDPYLVLQGIALLAREAGA